ncbi:rod shape-determining protein RodA [Duganella violaceipulchra]|uniref:Peptidoglycan glycosyltransferase MrdB n=1 Tax=Duganella violaceipulchra TaxID=2849652 RepID=A0AA41HFQ8_9BURK|nr:rod shape-determining protein RodA [Duganella violaceicalia]MBV6324197.1 rod shape-determining protein RodA [Duganella violaceicalia]MCP2011870.1 rod shape determining protein RodA [Duganella violaceicalia]
MRVQDGRTLWQRVRPYFTVFDAQLAIIMLLLLSVGLVTLYSAGIAIPGKVTDQLRNICMAFLVMWMAANTSPQMMMRVAVPAYALGVALLVAVALVGTIKGGSRRWLTFGVQVQPSEFMKIAMPLMMAWFFQRQQGQLRWHSYLIAALLLAIPVGLIARQPDLGTAMLVVAAGACVIFLGGLSWKAMAALGATACAGLPVLWTVMHDYQRDRVLTLIDPYHDPLGKGFHIIQSMIAIGSGGVSGKGWTHGTQAHLEFIPERTTDFIFAVFSEEFGLAGNLVLLVLYLLLIVRGLNIAVNASTFFTRLLAGSITMIYFTYAFVNMGMVSGIVPVVGVPLPFMSYGGTALMTLGLGAGILMSIQHHSRGVRGGASTRAWGAAA